MARDASAYMIDGARVPSVTEILSIGGWSDFSGIDPEILARAAARGTFVHEASELHDEGDLDWDSVPREWVGYVRAYEKFKAERQFQIIESEVVVKNKLHRYAGQLDRRGLLDGKPVILDIKTSSQPSPSWGPQIAGYAACYAEPHGRVALWLRRDGTYRVISYPDPDDTRLFLATAAVVNGLISRGVVTPPWER